MAAAVKVAAWWRRRGDWRRRGRRRRRRRRWRQWRGCRAEMAVEVRVAAMQAGGSRLRVGIVRQVQRELRDLPV